MKKNLYDLRIKDLQITEYNIVTIILTDNSHYTADLSQSFSTLFCYPKNLKEWKEAHIVYGSAIEWTSGFDIHFDQIIAISKEQKHSA